MKRQSLTVVALAIGCGLAASAAHAQTADEILDRNFAAKGGEALRAVQSVRQTMSVDLQGTTAEVVVYSQRPNLVRQEMTVAGQTVIQAYDGRVAWTRGSIMAPAAAAPLSGHRADAIRTQASFDGMLIEARTAGRDVEMVGTVLIDGREHHHLRIVDDWQVRHCFVDARTALETRIVQETAAGRLQQDLSDYRDVGGIRLPFTIRTSVNGRPSSVVTVTDVVLNVPVDRTLFGMPR